MDKAGLSDKTKMFLAQLVASGEKWLVEEIEKMFKKTEEEKKIF